MRKSKTVRVFIASPSDLREERETVAQAIREWNSQHAEAMNITLRPVAWELDSRPGSTVPVQQNINEKLLDPSD